VTLQVTHLNKNTDNNTAGTSSMSRPTDIANFRAAEPKARKLKVGGLNGAIAILKRGRRRRTNEKRENGGEMEASLLNGSKMGGIKDTC